MVYYRPQDWRLGLQLKDEVDKVKPPLTSDTMTQNQWNFPQLPTQYKDTKWFLGEKRQRLNPITEGWEAAPSIPEKILSAVSESAENPWVNLAATPFLFMGGKAPKIPKVPNIPVGKVAQAVTTKVNPVDKIGRILDLAKVVSAEQKGLRKPELKLRAARLESQLQKAPTLGEALKIKPKAGKLPEANESFFLDIKEMAKEYIPNRRDLKNYYEMVKSYKWKGGFEWNKANIALGKLQNVITGKIYTQDMLPTQYEAKLLGQVFGKKLEQSLSNLGLSKLQKVNAVLTTIFYNNLLSGPKTHILNSTSNLFRTFFGPAQRFGAALVEAPVAKLQGRPPQRFVGEAGAEVFGVLRGIPEGVKGALRAWKEAPIEAVSKYELPSYQIPGKLGKVINLPSKFLQMEDEFFKGINVTAATRAEAYRMAKQAGLKGDKLAAKLNQLIANPPDELVERAAQIAEERLYRQPLGKVGQKIMGLRNAEIGGFQPLRFVVPFLKTPTNLIKFGLEASPLGLINPKMWSMLKNKSPEFADKFARTAIGSSIAAALALYVADDKITGPAPTNIAERDRFYREGKIPFAIKVGNTWVSYQRFEPFNLIFAQVAAVVEGIKKGESVSDRVGRIVSTIGQNLISQTWVTSLSDIFDAIEDPEAKAKTFAQRFVSSAVVPFSALSRTIEQSVSPEIEKPQNIPQAIMGNIPGLSANVPKRLTAFGEVSTRESPVWSPISIGIGKDTPLNKELSRLSFNIGFVGKTIENRELTFSEQQVYQAVVGNLIKQRLESAIKMPTYKALGNDEKKKKYLDSVVSKARADAKDQVLKRLGKSQTTGVKPSGKVDFSAIRR